mmetsp:Transcript_6357/g.7818  ORF Transcript_6357/g.7818 Transcript_6357/m.7818 type:complete len:319 (-) Transcript_6357:631-1587(-)
MHPDIMEIRKLLEELTITLETTKTRIESLLFEHERTLSYCRGLESYVSRLKIDNYKLEVENKEFSKYHFQLCLLAENMACFIDTSPHNSPTRRPLLKHLIEGLEKQFSKDLFCFSERSYYRILKTEDGSILYTKYAQGTHRNTVSPRMSRIIAQFLDMAFGLLYTGKDYRIQRGPFHFVYNQYCEYLKQVGWPGKPCAESYLRKCICKDNIRKVVKVDICPICAGTTKRKYSKKEIEEHKQLWYTQKAAMKGQMEKLRTGILKGCLIVQDFSQIDLSPSGYIQDFIVVVYKKEIDYPALERTYLHYVGNSGEKNDYTL